MFVTLALAAFVSPTQLRGAETLTVNGSGTLLHALTDPQNLPSQTGALTMASSDVVRPTFAPQAIAGLSMLTFRASSSELNAVSQVVPAALANADSSHGSLLPQHEPSTFGTDVTPVPESSTWLTALLAVGGLVYLQRHRFLRRDGAQQTT
jgi:hypothetical protein